MKKEVIFEKIQTCVEKAGITGWFLSADEDADSDIYFYKDRFWVLDIKTQYTEEDFQRISYRKYSEEYLELGEFNYVKILFKNGDRIFLEDEMNIGINIMDGRGLITNFDEVKHILRTRGHDKDALLATNE